MVIWAIVNLGKRQFGKTSIWGNEVRGNRIRGNEHPGKWKFDAMGFGEIEFRRNLIQGIRGNRVKGNEYEPPNLASYYDPNLKYRKKNVPGVPKLLSNFLVCG